MKEAHSTHQQIVNIIYNQECIESYVHRNHFAPDIVQHEIMH